MEAYTANTLSSSEGTLTQVFPQAPGLTQVFPQAPGLAPTG